MYDQVCTTDFEESKWYALFLRSNQEKRVADCLNSLMVENFLPCYFSVRQWKDRRVTLEMPLFPGYIFVRLPFRERMKVLTIRQVVTLVGTKNSPSVISDSEIAGIRAGIEHGRAAPHDYLEAGQRIVITDGVMCGMEGILLTVRSRARVVISIQSIGRAFVVEVSASCVRPLLVQPLNDMPTNESPDPASRFALSKSVSLQGCAGDLAVA
jgi:transcription antitermination factor NusG